MYLLSSSRNVLPSDPFFQQMFILTLPKAAIAEMQRISAKGRTMGSRRNDIHDGTIDNTAETGYTLRLTLSKNKNIGAWLLHDL